MYVYVCVCVKVPIYQDDDDDHDDDDEVAVSVSSILSYAVRVSLRGRKKSLLNHHTQLSLSPPLPSFSLSAACERASEAPRKTFTPRNLTRTWGLQLPLFFSFLSWKDKIVFPFEARAESVRRKKKKNFDTKTSSG